MRSAKAGVIVDDQDGRACLHGAIVRDVGAWEVWQTAPRRALAAAVTPPAAGRRRRCAQCEANSPPHSARSAFRSILARMTSTEQQHARPSPRGPAHGTSPRASRRPGSSSRAPRARASPTPTAGSSSTSPAASAARTRATDSARSSTRSTGRPTCIFISASWSASTSRTSRPAGCFAELSPCAGAQTRSRSSSTRAPRRTRTP